MSKEKTFYDINYNFFLRFQNIFLKDENFVTSEDAISFTGIKDDKIISSLVRFRNIILKAENFRDFFYKNYFTEEEISKYSHSELSKKYYNLRNASIKKLINSIEMVVSFSTHDFIESESNIINDFVKKCKQNQNVGMVSLLDHTKELFSIPFDKKTIFDLKRLYDLLEDVSFDKGESIDSELFYAKKILYLFKESNYKNEIKFHEYSLFGTCLNFVFDKSINHILTKLSKNQLNLK